MRRDSFVLSIDIGTSSTRAGLFDDAGMPHGTTAHHPTSMRTDVDGKAVLDSAGLLAGVVGCVDEVLAAHAGAEILGVGVSCFWHGLLGVDAGGRATTDVLTWADRRAGHVADTQR
ncbi:MAG: carbohydrate kinase, partial [Comamonadaceae bacterium]